MKIIITMLVLLLLISNLFWLYIAVDHAVSDSYSEKNSDFKNKMLEQTVHVANLNVIGMHAAEAKSKLGLSVYGFVPYEKDGCIIVGEVCLKLNEARLVVTVIVPHEV